MTKSQEQTCPLDILFTFSYVKLAKASSYQTFTPAPKGAGFLSPDGQFGQRTAPGDDYGRVGDDSPDEKELYLAFPSDSLDLARAGMLRRGV